MAIMAKRTVMTLYSDPNDMYSHQVRIVLAEKGVNVEIINHDPVENPQELVALNPYNTVPTLLDRDLVLYDARIIMEYLEERFPHPPLLPVYPVMRAQTRKMMHRIERDWYSLAKVITEGNSKEVSAARKHLEDSLLNLAPVFSDKPFFFSEEFSLIDCCIAPLLWRLPQFEIELSSKAKPIKQYMSRVFERESFQASLTDIEREIWAA